VSELAAAVSVFFAVLVSAAAVLGERGFDIWRAVAQTAWRWRGLLQLPEETARGRDVFVPRRFTVGLIATGAVGGWMTGGWSMALAGAVLVPGAARFALRIRRDRHAASADGAAAELALAIASALSAGHSVRGALIAAAANSPEPLEPELQKLAADLTLGDPTDVALAALRTRTRASRVETITGAIELHRRCGGDLANLLRELGRSFRAAELARRDAHAATAQARFTAWVVAGAPLLAAVLTELGRPGAVTGAFAFAPTAALMLVSLLMLGTGCLLSYRMGRV
jgi:tight adherence protein B